MKLLHLDSSILGDNSASRRLSAAIVHRMEALHPDLVVEYHDLAAEPLPALDLATFQALAETAEMRAYLAADIVVIGAGLYNFTIPGQLKNWMDRIVLRGVTFDYRDGAPVGLVPNKRVIVGMTKGGVYTPGTPRAAYDHGQTLLSSIFGFLGVRLDFVLADGLSAGGAAREQVIEAALARAAQLPA